MSGEIIYRRASKSDLTGIAKLHKKCFQDYFLTSLGLKMIYRYYEEYIQHDNLTYVAEFNDIIVGFVTGNISSFIARKSFIHKNKVSLFLIVLKGCLCFDKRYINRAKNFVISLFKNLFKNFASNRTQKTDNVLTGRLLSICVAEKFRGKYNIALNLVQILEKGFTDIGVRQYGLSCNKENRQAINFYKKSSFLAIGETSSGLQFDKKISL